MHHSSVLLEWQDATSHPVSCQIVSAPCLSQISVRSLTSDLWMAAAIDLVDEAASALALQQE